MTRPVSPSGWAVWAVLLAAGLAMAATLNGYYVYVLANVALLAIVGIGMNVLLGLAGQVSFGHVGFYAIGAYAVAVLTTKAGLSFWLAWPIGVLLSGAVGLLLSVPALRVKGPYLAMVTIAFGFIVEHGAVEWRDVTGGQNGIMGIAAPAVAGFPPGERTVAALAVLACAVLLLLYAWLDKSAWGAALRAVRDSEVASESIGISPVRVKAVAFALSAALAGLAGGLFAPLSGFVTPQTFGMLQSILFVLVVMVGGAGTVVGPLIGALVVGVLPELLSGMEEYRLLFFGVLLLVVLWAAPQGVAGLLGGLWIRRQPALTPPPSAASPMAVPAGARARGVLRVQGLGRQFGGVRAVHELGFETVPGGVTALIGPNGAGKTTVLNMLSGFYKPTAGGFSLQGTALQGRAAHALARAGIARSYQTSQLFGSLSVEDNVALGLCRGRLGSPLGVRRFHAPAARERARALLAQCGYTGAPQAPAADLAHVDKRLVEIARALATDPQLLLLDEPAAGLSREDKTRLTGLLRAIADTGIGVVIVEHDMAMVMDLSDRIVVLDAGQRLAMGAPAEVRADPAVRRAYLGESGLQATRGTRAPATPAEEVLGIGALQTGYGAEPVLHGVALSVRAGQMAALLGANGAGKSTLMRSLAGLHRPVAGGIHLRGRELAGLGAEQIAALGLVLVPEGRQVFPELSVLDNLRLGAFLKPEGREARIDDMLERFPRLRERLQQRAGLLSGGEQQMLAIARGLMAQPQVLLLDEPSLGLAPKVIEDLFAVLSRLRDERMTLLLVDQMAGLALSLADHAYVLESGRIVAQGSAAQLLADGALMRAYLGE
ncbi:branched-chain amino acid ABC transporter ATP-binding protein/permease [Pseudorhodoferax sp. Leaf267]|uniref:branched-chain amino acid ABC transporter ATP-binding protein/permease n=1 Tax=Pseudorhodoferax sp. Leaf267 TaxID=1736316 RepID=UPI0006FC1906|nr:branched-chain amino acid ABC transporter ATP-binding protein/permease [Pseudorhodoferax sp. Leaf267]KQP14115.1 ABC transporter [Pseudorhodoferax sp. Leaf267]